ncbi:TRAP transporter substrate-binding protein DctP [Desulforhopalus sp. IMCC35007]|uniref:TRAP transporter substrate-binding protein n=1 Tax=Desulforhopalus sp. IMCC35007 TaxID=2569543 RepID=UPI0010AEB55D|nr:TRAP transporter substrate-binding protein DctP [Desulforhopalus sp. IMCC35007]TKB11779.1 TRAP transporter substrate-binding protein DctP [Desulforhopalus sp. IMCC35007]
MKRLSTLTISLTLLILFCVAPLQAAPKYLFKVATLAPAGSVWIEQFDKFAASITKETGGEVAFRIYPGGVMGDDQAMIRKMRVGQLQGGGFTMTGVSMQVPDFRVLGIPFLFESYDEVDYVRNGLMPDFMQKFRENNLEIVAMTEVGFIYAMSTKPIDNYIKFKDTKNWSPTGDPISEAFMKTLGITPTSLTIPDVLSSLQSGLVETVYNSLYGSIVMQWFTKAQYIVDFPYGYAYGVFALDAKKFNKLPPAHQEIIHKAASTYFPILLAETRKSNEESQQVLKERGNTFLTLDKETIGILREKRDLAMKQMIPDAVSEQIYNKTIELLDEYRGSK